MLYRHSALAIAAAIGRVGLCRRRRSSAGRRGPGLRAARPAAFRAAHQQDDVEFDSGRGRFDHRQDFDDGPRGPEAYPHRRPTGFDDRDGDLSGYSWRRPPHGNGDPRWDRGDDHPGYGARFDHPYGRGLPGPAPTAPRPYEEIVAPLAPPVYEDRRGPDVGCTIQRSETTTAVGWQKIVTHKTCYRR